MLYGHDSYACFAFYFLPPSFTCIITHIICWHKGSASNFKAAHWLTVASFLSLITSVWKKKMKKFQLFIFAKTGSHLSEAELMSRYGTFAAMIGSGCRFIQDVEENLFCRFCFFSPHPKRRWQVLAFYFQLLDSQRSRMKICSSHFTISTDSCSEHKKKKQKKPRKCDSSLVQKRF